MDAETIDSQNISYRFKLIFLNAYELAIYIPYIKLINMFIANNNTPLLFLKKHSIANINLLITKIRL